MKNVFSAISLLLILPLLLAACAPAAPDTSDQPSTTDSTSPIATEPTSGDTSAPTQTTPQPTESVSTDPQPTETAPTETQPTETEPAPTESQPTETTPAETDPQPTEPTPTDPEEPEQLPQTNVYLVGDSTVCEFADAYFYPRYGYGTQLSNYLNDKVTIHNLALSGRSSKSFILEENYQTLLSNLKAGDYLIISFGHNDEKSDDAARFTDASKDYTIQGSFGYYLYQYYIKVAREKGATAILCTPIVRAATDNDYSGTEAHITSNGDYRKAIVDLGAAENVPVIDLTSITKARYSELGYAKAIEYHATIAGKYASDGVTVIANVDTVDKTHLNIYGAKYVAYRLAKELKNVSGIGNYVLDNIQEPTAKDLQPNPNYVVPDYAAPDLANYTPADQFKTISDGWYGTAFGDVGGNPQSSGNGYVAKEDTAGIFTVGQSAGSSKGKFSTSTDGFAFVFRQVEASKNFKLTVTATVITAADSVNQAGFGLMLRDDVYLNESATNSSIKSNYVTAGLLGGSSSTTVLFSRENGSLTKGDKFGSTAYAAGDTFTMTIERVGQSVTCAIIHNGTTYTTTHYDFDFFAVDSEYMYVGMFANRGTIVEYTDVRFSITGDSQGA